MSENGRTVSKDQYNVILSEAKDLLILNEL